MLTDKEIETIIKVMMPYHPKKIGIFGSYARGENSEDSDVDILYLFEEPISLFQKADLQENLNFELKKKIDLVSEKYIHPMLKNSILKDLKVIYNG